MRFARNGLLAAGLLVTAFALPVQGQIAQDTGDGVEEFQALADAYKEAAKAFDNLPEAETTKEALRRFEEQYPSNTMGDQFFRLEEKHRGTQVGLSCLHYLVSIAGSVTNSDLPVSTNRRKAILILQEHYLGHADLDLIFWWFRLGARYPEAISFLRRAATDSPHPHVRGNALYNLASLLVKDSQIPQELETLLRLMLIDEDEWKDHIERIRSLQPSWDDVDPEQSQTQALQVVDQIMADYANVLESPRTGYGPLLLDIKRDETDHRSEQKRRPIGPLATAVRFELEHLLIGRPAPNLSQPDAFGNDLDLGKHHGKVVVLMFSFKGCGPCEAMYPSNRELIEEMQGRPFAFLGVMSDETIETVHESVENKAITWPVWWEGPERVIATKWNVRSFPSIIVIDHQGIIRLKGFLQSSLVKQAVQELIEAAENGEDTGS